MDKMIEHFNQGINFDGLYQKDVALRFCVLLALKYADGNAKRLTRPTLVRAVWGIWNRFIGDDVKPKERKIRNTIRDLRKEGALILSTGGAQGGYWKAESLEEVKAFIEEEYRSRAFDMLHTASKMYAAAQKQFGGQIALRTYG